MRALVTGAAGFIGRHVVRALLDAGADVVAFDRAFANQTSSRTTGLLDDVTELVAGDVLDPDSVARALVGCDAVFHLAAIYSYARADEAAMQAINVRGTQTVLDAASRGGTRRIIHTSTCATCGPVPGRPANERDVPPARELAVPYKRTKLEGERLALAAARGGADVVIVNPTVPVGADDLRPTPTGKMVADVAHGRARGYLARSALNIVAVQDVAIGHLRALEHGRAGERYLLGGENLSIRDVFAAIATTAGRPVPRIGVPWVAAYAAARVADAAMRPIGREPGMLLLDEVRAGRIPHLFDDAKARSELDYTSRTAHVALAEATRAVLAAKPTDDRS